PFTRNRSRRPSPSKSKNATPPPMVSTKKRSCDSPENCFQAMPALAVTSEKKGRSAGEPREATATRAVKIAGHSSAGIANAPMAGVGGRPFPGVRGVVFLELFFECGLPGGLFQAPGPAIRPGQRKVRGGAGGLEPHRVFEMPQRKRGLAAAERELSQHGRRLG